MNIDLRTQIFLKKEKKKFQTWYLLRVLTNVCKLLKKRILPKFTTEQFSFAPDFTTIPHLSFSLPRSSNISDQHNPRTPAISAVFLPVECACVHALLCACRCTQRPQVDTEHFLPLISTLFTEAGPLCLMVLPTRLNNAPSLWTLLVLLLGPRCWDYRQPPCLPGFYMGSGNPHSDLGAYAAEASSQAFICSF